MHKPTIGTYTQRPWLQKERMRYLTQATSKYQYTIEIRVYWPSSTIEFRPDSGSITTLDIL